MMTRRLNARAWAYATVATAALLAGTSTAYADFRVQPYLQQPTSEGMLFTWFTETDTPGTLIVDGSGLPNPLEFTSTPVNLAPVLDYTQAERDQAANLGYPLLGETNFKHSVQVSGLSPDTTYTYSVAQNSATVQSTFKTAPTANDWNTKIRLIALSDSETEPRGNTNRRDWSNDAQAPGSIGRPNNWPQDSAGRDLYPLTETEGYRQNVRIIKERKPDMIIMPGDLVQGGGYQLGWDEFFRHNAGEYDTPLSETPIAPTMGNWENFGAINGGYNIDPNTGENAPKRGRDKYKAYFDMPSNGTPEHQDNYYRVDYGPITLLTLDSSNGLPDQINRDPNALDTDTQSNINAADYAAAAAVNGEVSDLSDFNPGSAQYNWVVEQLEDARDQGQIVLAQWHHIAYSSGTHSLPMSDPNSTGQAGTPMRQYQPLFEEFGVVGVLSGHSEMFERSFVDLDGDGIGVLYFDVGVAGDGVRGVRTTDPNELNALNPFSQWTASLDEPELWVEVTDPNTGETYPMLIDGGKHYGHLEIEIMPLDDPKYLAMITFIPVYSFPILDENFELIGDTERRVYGDEFFLFILADGTPAAAPVPAGLALFGIGLAAFGLTRRRRG